MAGVLNSGELKPGAVFVDGHEKFVVIKYWHIKKGRGPAVIRVKVKNIETLSITEKTYSSEQRFEQADVEKRTAQYLYSDASAAYFMDTADYSQFALDKEMIEWELNFLKDGEKVVTMYLDGSPISIETPKSVELKVTNTSSAIAGNTATGATKEAEVETGYHLQVPLFIKTGDVLRINTEMGTYTSRA
jgi:elongation factor P